MSLLQDHDALKMHRAKGKVLKNILKEKKKGDDRLRTAGLVDSIEPVIYVDPETEEATKAFLAQFYTEKDGKPSYPSVVVDEKG